MENIEIKEPIKKLSEKEINNSLIIDLLLMNSKSNQMLMVLMDINNTTELNKIIGSEEYKNIQEGLNTAITNLSGVIKDFTNLLKEKNNNETMTENRTKNDDLQEPEGNN